MGTTPIFGFPYPDPSDLVANYPATAQQLAEDVEDAIYARKILQIVRATDATERSTTSTSFVDVTGMTVTITPQKSDSAILIVSTFEAAPSTNNTMRTQLTDASNNALSGAEQATFSGDAAGNLIVNANIIGQSTPATTSAVTYKLRFLTNAGTSRIRNNLCTGQMYAIEVSA
jgi:hypothetical protein